MPAEDDPIRERVIQHFSADAAREDVWKGLDLFLDTEAYLNLGFSRWYQPHWLPSSQRRLVDVVGWLLRAEIDRLERSDGSTDGQTRDGIGPSAVGQRGRRRTLPFLGARPEPRTDSGTATAGTVVDIGCGRGGPAVRLADHWGFEVLGVDFVESNVARARLNGQSSGLDSRVEFVLGEASRLPIGTGTVEACTAIDSLVYMPDPDAVLEDVARVLGEDGVFVASDLVTTSQDRGPHSGRGPGVEEGPGANERAAKADDPVREFTRQWDMPALRTKAALIDSMNRVGFDVRYVEDISDYSIRNFRRYTRLYLGLAAGRLEPLLRGFCRWQGMDEAVVTDQIRAAHRGLPHLEHVLVLGVSEGS